MKKNKINDIAITGFSCRFPGASNPEQFWKNLKNGVCSITTIPKERWDINKFFSPDIKDDFKTTTKYGGFIDDVYSFDAKYFRIKDERAELMDPQQRLILEVSAEAVNHAGYSKKELSGSRTSVFIAAGHGDYGSSNECLSPEGDIVTDGRMINSRNGFVGNIPNMIPAAISNYFNFMGPSFIISSACSSSLVAVHLACQSILIGESKLAIAGGIQLYLSPNLFIGTSKTGALSSGGKCRTFSKDADGYVLAEGVGICLLKSLDDAVKDKDAIYAIIKSSAINNDGKTMSVLMPNVYAQQNVVSLALEQAGIDAASMSYFEANGTALQVGDPLEINAVASAYRNYTDEKQYCVIGSVEPNIGHASHAAGMASLIKVILSLLNRQIVPALYCEELNPKIEFPNTPFYPSTELTEWKPRNNCRRAGINCFGFGGTNCHIILEDFDSNKYNNYKPERKPLSPVKFNRKTYRIQSIKEHGHKEISADLSSESAENRDEELAIQLSRDTPRSQTPDWERGVSRLNWIAQKLEEEEEDDDDDDEKNNIISEKIEKYLRKITAEKLAIPETEIDIEISFMDMGIDSVMLTDLTEQLTKDIEHEISPAIFFECNNIKELAKHFTMKYEQEFRNLLNISAEYLTGSSKYSGKKPREVFVAERFAVRARHDPVAIVGMSGRFPKARDVNEFWENLVQGRNCIEEIPGDRWDWKAFCGDPAEEADKTGTGWGGFIDDIDRFDPLFFNISPAEAELMDPQQRLLMTYVWKAIEDAGITPEKLSKDPTGVFIAAGPGEYMNIVSVPKDNPLTMTAMVPSIIPNRISYALNLRGPSEYCETACSSALTALHRAIQSILCGECEQAIAGAVNLLLSPAGFISIGAMGYLSPKGKARSFQADADGFVRSEGVGALIIKPLQKAEHDNDRIYAVIRGTGVSHGGRGMSLTAPTVTGMKSAMIQAYQASGIDPRTVSYMELHGTATMGDVIETDALKSGYQELAASFSQDSQTESPCYISTLKPCIGHGELVSGMAALIKVVMAIQHRLIPGVPRFTTLHENISLKGSPFQITAENNRWEAQTDTTGKTLPRRAGINSYGFGGVNAHVVIEEYKHRGPEIRDQKTRPHIFVLSAKNEEQLNIYARTMADFLENAGSATMQENESLADIAYTLQVGREAMEYRMAMVVSSKEELARGLGMYLKSVQEDKEPAFSMPVFTGNPKDDHAGIRNLLSGKPGETLAQMFIAENSLEKLALYWTQGGRIHWESLHRGESRRISLPTYPFEKRRCWLDNQLESVAEKKRPSESVAGFAGIEHTSADKLVIDIISRMSGMATAELDIDKPLAQYGFDSIMLIQLLQQLQTRTDPPVTLENLKECKTIQDIIDIVPQQVQNKPMLPEKDAGIAALSQFPEIIHLNQGSEGRPIFWFHPVQSGVEPYLEIARKSHRPFYGIQARGWMTDRQPLHGIQAIAAYYIHIIQSVQPHGPYSLGGYSLGGLLAYEITRQLEEMGQAVDTIVMIDSFYCDELKKIKLSQKSAILGQVNMALLSTIQNEPEKISQVLIHREEVNSNQEDDLFLNQLIALAKTRGLAMTEAQLQTRIQQSVKVQQAYELNNFSVLPLCDSKSVTCYYFRNKRGLFWGESEPYFLLAGDEFSLDNTNYWEEWEKQFSDFHMTDVDSSSHMMLLSDPKSSEVIIEFCEKIYSEPWGF